MKKHFDKNLIMTEGKENFQLSKNFAGYAEKSLMMTMKKLEIIVK